MRYKSLLLTTAVLAGALTMGAQETHTVNDTIFNPKIVFTSSPSTYELAGITVKGVDNYDNNIILGYSGLTIGQRIEVPGDDLKAVAKRFWRQGLFSKVQIQVDKIYQDRIWLTFNRQS